MTRSPVSMCLITRGEPLLEQALRSVREHVEELVVVVTSQKDAAGIATARALADRVEVFEGCNDEHDEIADFAAARNFSFSLATKPWTLWMDADDVVDLARLPEVLADTDALRVSSGHEVLVSFPYEYSYDAAGNCDLVLSRERLLSSRAAFTWSGIGYPGNTVHEVIVSSGPPVNLPPQDDRIVWKHRRHLSTKKFSSGERNVRILKKAYERNSSDPRTLLYYAIALSDTGQLGESVTILEKYVRCAPNEDEKMIALLRLARCELGRGRVEEAITWSLQSTTCKENWAEGYLMLAKAYHQRGCQTGDRRDWERCVHFTTVGLSLPPTKTFLWVDQTERTYWAHERMNYAMGKLGNPRGALESARRGLQARPDDTNLQLNVLMYEETLAKEDAKAFVGKMKSAALELARRFDFPRASAGAYDRLVAMVEDPRQADAPVLESPGLKAVENPPPKVDVGSIPGVLVNGHKSGLDIVFALGDCWETWTPETASQKGIGGSETAVIQVSKRLAARGHHVRVFTSTTPGTYDGVEYLPTSELRYQSRCDVLVVWRNAPLLDLPIQARTRLLWVHDVYAVGATPENLAKADKVLALSAWHRQFLAQHHKISVDKVFQTRNGVDLDLFVATDVVRDPHKCVYSSSADRGLEELLKVWTRIRTEVPDATLQIFYGFHNWESMAKASGDEEALRRISRIKGIIDVLGGAGVTLRGRVDPRTIAREFLSAGAWLYPTWFTETSCITAMEAQAAGLRIVTSPIAALVETVGDRGVLIEGDSKWADYQEKFVRAAVAMLRVPEELIEKSPIARQSRRMLQAHARENFSWDGVIEQWEQELFPAHVIATDVSVSAPFRSDSRSMVSLPPVEKDPNAYEGVL